MVKAATGGVNAEVFIEFLKRLLVGETRTIFLILTDDAEASRQRPRQLFAARCGAH